MTSSRPRGHGPLLVALAVIGVAVAAGGTPAAALPTDRPTSSVQLDDDLSAPGTDTTPVDTAIEAPGDGTTTGTDPTDGASPTDASEPAPAATEVTPTEEPSPTDATSPTPAPSEDVPTQEPSPTDAPGRPGLHPLGYVTRIYGSSIGQDGRFLIGRGPTTGGAIIEPILDGYDPGRGDVFEMCGRRLDPIDRRLFLSHFIWTFVTPPCAAGEATINVVNPYGTLSGSYLYVTTPGADGAGSDSGSAGTGSGTTSTATRLATTGGGDPSALLAALAMLTLGAALVEAGRRARARAS